MDVALIALPVNPTPRWLKRVDVLSFKDAVARLLSFQELPVGRPDLQLADADDMDVVCAVALSEAQTRDAQRVQFGLSLDEACAIIAYTMEDPYPLYRLLNAWMNSDRHDPEVKLHVGPFAALLIRSLMKLPLVSAPAGRAIKVEGIPRLVEVFENPDNHLPVGGAANFWGFSSFSTNDKVLESPAFAGKQTILYKCASLAAVDVSPFSVMPKEREVLPIPPAMFMVQVTAKHGKVLFVALKQVDHSAHAYLEPPRPPAAPCVGGAAAAGGGNIALAPQPLVAQHHIDPGLPLPAPVPAMDTAAHCRRLCALLQQHYEDEFVKFIPDRSGNGQLAVPMAAVFTKLCVVGLNSLQKHYHDGGTEEDLVDIRTPDVCDIETIASVVSEVPVTLLEGRAGIGKTTFAQRLCQLQLFAPSELTVFVRLTHLERRWANETRLPSTFRKLLHDAVPSMSAANLSTICRLRIPVRFVLDGLDEVQQTTNPCMQGFLWCFVSPKGRREQIAQQLQQEQEKHGDDDGDDGCVRACDRVIITSREEFDNAVCPLQDADRWVVRGWTLNEARRYVTEFFRNAAASAHDDSAGEEDAVERSVDSIMRVLSIPSMRGFAVLPLTCEIICVAQYTAGSLSSSSSAAAAATADSLPASPDAMYAFILRHLWESARSSFAARGMSELHTAANVDLVIREASRLCFETLQKSKGSAECVVLPRGDGKLSHWTVLATVCGLFQRSFVRLDDDSVAPASAKFSCPHRSYLEYLAAVHVFRGATKSACSFGTMPLHATRRMSWLLVAHMLRSHPESEKLQKPFLKEVAAKVRAAYAVVCKSFKAGAAAPEMTDPSRFTEFGKQCHLDVVAELSTILPASACLDALLSSVNQFFGYPPLYLWLVEACGAHLAHGLLALLDRKLGAKVPPEAFERCVAQAYGAQSQLLAAEGARAAATGGDGDGDVRELIAVAERRGATANLRLIAVMGLSSAVPAAMRASRQPTPGDVANALQTSLSLGHTVVAHEILSHADPSSFLAYLGVELQVKQATLVAAVVWKVSTRLTTLPAVSITNPAGAQLRRVPDDQQLFHVACFPSSLWWDAPGVEGQLWRKLVEVRSVPTMHCVGSAEFDWLSSTMHCVTPGFQVNSVHLSELSCVVDTVDGAAEAPNVEVERPDENEEEGKKRAEELAAAVTRTVQKEEPARTGVERLERVARLLVSLSCGANAAALRFFRLTRCKFGSHGLTILEDALCGIARAPSLDTLDLSYNELDQSCAHALARLMLVARCTIHANNNRLRGGGVQAVAKEYLELVKTSNERDGPQAPAAAASPTSISAPKVILTFNAVPPSVASAVEAQVPRMVVSVPVSAADSTSRRKGFSRFKAEFTFEERHHESSAVRERHPDRLPVICEKKPSSNITDLDKNKFLVPDDLTVGQFVLVIRKRIMLEPEKAIFLLIGGSVPANAKLMADLYSRHKDEDGFLYVQYSGETTFDIGIFDRHQGSVGRHLLLSSDVANESDHDAHRQGGQLPQGVRLTPSEIVAWFPRAVCAATTSTAQTSWVRVLGHLPPPFRSEHIAKVRNYLVKQFESRQRAGLDHQGEKYQQGHSDDDNPRDFKLDLTLEELSAMVGDAAAASLVSLLNEPLSPQATTTSIAQQQRHADADSLSIVMRRSCCEGEMINFHTDVARKTLQLTLVGDDEYDGGRLTYLCCSASSSHGDADEDSRVHMYYYDVFQPRRPAGCITIHDQSVVHGVSQLTRGVRMSLFLLLKKKREKE